MRRRSPIHSNSGATPAPSARGLVAAYLLVLLIPVGLWAASEALLVAAALAGAVGAVAVQIGLAYAATRLGGDRRRHVCVPVTGVCVEF